MTEKLYEKDVYRTSCQAKVVSSEIIHEEKTKKKPEAYYALIELDKTVFFPEGGGQPCDRGEIEYCPVTDVRERGGKIIHKVLVAGRDRDGSAKGPEDACEYFDRAAWEQEFAPGNILTCEIDYDRRFENMQRHCGEHILSGVFFRLFGGVNHGFHMGERYMTIDIGLDTEPGGDVPGETGSAIKYASSGDDRWTRPVRGLPGADAVTDGSHKGGGLTEEMLREAEDLANRIIRADLPVTVAFCGSHEEAMVWPLRKEMDIENDVSVVTIGDPEAPADCCACCGTHPSGTAQVGLIKIYKCEKNGDWSRVFFDAGSKAMEEYDRVYDIMTDISGRFTTSIESTPDALDAYMERASAAHERLTGLLRTVTSQRADEIASMLKRRDDEDLVAVKYSDLVTDDILKIGHLVQERLGIDPRGKKKPDSVDAALLDKPLCLISASENILILFSNGKANCGKLVKDNAGIYGGKGGGSAVSARAMFADSESVDLFVDLIGKHLR
ncbi:MAG: alanyl-tRNA editing protein [Anaerovoracaceae bacterium]|jgi:alanyl-tRNA synthetase